MNAHGHNVKPFRIISLVGVCFIGSVILMTDFKKAPWKTAEPVNMALVAENRKVMELCKANENKCFGGFVRFRDNDVILQMKTHFEMGMAFHGGTDSDLDNLEYIILPGDEDWKKARDAHAEQFVVKK